MDINELKQMYDKSGLMLDKAIALWKQASYTTSDIQEQIFYDTNVKITDTAAADIYKYATSTFFDYLADRDHELDALVTRKLSKLTPNLKKELTKVGSNQYTFNKIAEHNVWKIVQREEDGKTAFYLARINDKVKDDKKKCASEEVPMQQAAQPQVSEVLIEKIDYANGAINLLPTNCPGKGKVNDLQTGDDGKPLCIMSGKSCPHLQSFTLAPLNGDKTIKCNVK